MTHSSSRDTVFGAIPLLDGLPEPWRARLIGAARPWHAAPGALLFDVGDGCYDFALLSAGVLRVSKPISSGQDILLYRLQPGELCVISTSCFLGKAPYPVRGVVETEARGVLLPGMLVREVLEVHAPFREVLFGTLAERLAGLMALIEELVASRLDRRLAALLLEHAPVVHTTHQQLADELLSSREVVSRLLERFEGRGYVSLHRGRIELLDVDALGELAHADSGT